MYDYVFKIQFLATSTNDVTYNCTSINLKSWGDDVGSTKMETLTVLYKYIFGWNIHEMYAKHNQLTCNL